VSIAPPQSKSEIRKAVLARREALGAHERAASSARITEKLLALDAYRRASCVMAYMSFGSEFDTAAFLADLLARGKKLVLPRIERERRALKPCFVSDPARDLAPGVWGILEPRPELCPEAAVAQVEFVLVPGVAFTERCERLGYGGGFYDAFIRALPHRPALVAAAFSVQIVPQLPLTERDRAVDLVVTEDADYWRAR
jgi:5-formyltetrahydrofolate cyclo-ligase